MPGAAAVSSYCAGTAVLALVLLAAEATTQCPALCQCVSLGINCSHTGVAVVPNLVNAAVLVVRLKGNALVNLGERDFVHTPAVEIL